MASIDFIVLRSSPDWRSFDIEQSRSFCRLVGIPDDAVINFAATWDSTFGISYREFRAVCKDIAFRSFDSCIGMEVIRREDIPRCIGPESRFFFTDDDDWFHPDIASICRDLLPTAPDRGGYWGSIRHGYRPWTPPHEEFSELIVEKRPLKPTLYTNNYFCSGGQMASASLDDVFEHWNAHNILHGGRLQMSPIERYLSGANKHPACTVFLMKAMNFSQDRQLLYDLVSAACDAFDGRSFDEELAWVQPYSDEMALLLTKTLASATKLASADEASA
jgi:hypothetical protein